MWIHLESTYRRISWVESIFLGVLKIPHPIKLESPSPSTRMTRIDRVFQENVAVWHVEGFLNPIGLSEVEIGETARRKKDFPIFVDPKKPGWNSSTSFGVAKKQWNSHFHPWKLTWSFFNTHLEKEKQQKKPIHFFHEAEAAKPRQNWGCSIASVTGVKPKMPWISSTESSY